MDDLADLPVSVPEGQDHHANGELIHSGLLSR